MEDTEIGKAAREKRMALTLSFSEYLFINGRETDFTIMAFIIPLKLQDGGQLRYILTLN